MIEINRSIKSIMYITIFITIAILIAAAIILIKANNTLKPDYAPGIVDKNAVPLPPSQEKLEATEGGGAVSLSYSNKVAINMVTKKVTLYFQNPDASTHDLVLDLVIEKNNKKITLAKSELIPAGYAIYELKLEDVKLSQGGYNGKFVVSYYDSDTSEKAIINTEIPVTIAVE